MNTLNKIKYWENDIKEVNSMTTDDKNTLDKVNLKVSRVNQLDAELLDKELNTILYNKLTCGFDLFKLDIKTKFEPELQLILQSILFYFSFHGKFKASYGAMLQNLRFRNEFSKYTNLKTKVVDPTTIQLALYALLTVGGQYAWSRWSNSAVGGGWGDDDSSNSWKAKLYKIASSLEKWFKLINWLHSLHFIAYGSYRNIIERILGMRLVMARANGPPQLNFEFLNRQMVWDGFTEFLLFIAPMINLPKLTNKLRKVAMRLTGMENDGMYNKAHHLVLKELPEEICSYCYYYKNLAADVTRDYNEDLLLDDTDLGLNPQFIGALDCRAQLPYISKCGHRYCYQCIMTLISSSDEQPLCLKCHNKIDEVKRLEKKLI